jgi:hypothetical protein
VNEQINFGGCVKSSMKAFARAEEPVYFPVKRIRLSGMVQNIFGECYDGISNGLYLLFG